MTSDARENPDRCQAVKKNRQPCTATAVRNGYCFGQAPELEATRREARRKGGAATSKASRASKLLPSRLRPVAELLEKALEEVHSGLLDPRKATAMSSLASALIRVFEAGQMEERLRTLEEKLK